MNTPWLKYISCLLSLVCLVITIIILVKVTAKCKNTNENYEIQPDLNNLTGKYQNGSVNDCINNVIDENIGSDSYYCDGTLIDPTDDTIFCTGAAAFIADQNSNRLGSCNYPINSNSSSSYVLCSSNTAYPLGTDRCASPVVVSNDRSLPDDVYIVKG